MEMEGEARMRLKMEKDSNFPGLCGLLKNLSQQGSMKVANWICK